MTHQARTIVFPTFLAEMLSEQMAGPGLLFPDQRGGYIRETNWKRRAFDPAAKAAGLTPPTLRVHDLRHTAVSLAIGTGATVKVVQRQLGQRSAAVTLDRYAHMWPDELDGLGDALKKLRADPPADSVRTLGSTADVVPLKKTSDLRLQRWGGQDSNLRPEDYESPALTD